MTHEILHQTVFVLITCLLLLGVGGKLYLFPFFYSSQDVSKSVPENLTEAKVDENQVLDLAESMFGMGSFFFICACLKHRMVHKGVKRSLG